jgi:hypothetical protein
MYLSYFITFDGDESYEISEGSISRMKVQPMVFIKRPKLAISEETYLIHGYRSLETYDHF